MDLLKTNYTIQNGEAVRYGETTETAYFETLNPEVSQDFFHQAYLPFLYDYHTVDRNVYEEDTGSGEWWNEWNGNQVIVKEEDNRETGAVNINFSEEGQLIKHDIY